MNKVVIKTTYTNEAGTNTIKEVTLFGDKTVNIERENIDGNVSPTIAQFDQTIDYTKILAFAMGVTRAPSTPAVIDPLTGAILTPANSNAGNITVKIGTNSATLPTDSWTVGETAGVSWAKGDPTTNPITANVTSIHLTGNPALLTGVQAKFNFAARFLIDSTPSLAD